MKQMGFKMDLNEEETADEEPIQGTVETETTKADPHKKRNNIIKGTGMVLGLIASWAASKVVKDVLLNNMPAPKNKLESVFIALGVAGVSGFFGSMAAKEYTKLAKEVIYMMDQTEVIKEKVKEKIKESEGTQNG
jgi:uncharacterized membrane protein (Fun14 family)